MGESLTQRRRVREEVLRDVNRFSGYESLRIDLPRNKSRLTSCQQPRQDEGGERCSVLLGLKRV